MADLTREPRPKLINLSRTLMTPLINGSVRRQTRDEPCFYPGSRDRPVRSPGSTRARVDDPPLPTPGPPGRRPRGVNRL